MQNNSDKNHVSLEMDFCYEIPSGNAKITSTKIPISSSRFIPFPTFIFF